MKVRIRNSEAITESARTTGLTAKTFSLVLPLNEEVDFRTHKTLGENFQTVNSKRCNYSVEKDSSFVDAY